MKRLEGLHSFVQTAKRMPNISALDKFLLLNYRKLQEIERKLTLKQTGYLKGP